MAQIKLCGLRLPEQIREASQRPIDYLGLIFYAPSPRFVGDDFHLEEQPGKPVVGVFLNAEEDYILRQAESQGLAALQLHGQEKPEFCQKLSLRTGLPVWKALPATVLLRSNLWRPYEGAVASFLFDTPSPQGGGSGQPFDWTLLENYRGETPFWLSGGLHAGLVPALKQVKHPALRGYDLSSRVEHSPGHKNFTLVDDFLTQIHTP